MLLGNNIAVGHDALENNQTGGYNVAVGSGALVNNVQGNKNTAIGQESSRCKSRWFK